LELRPSSLELGTLLDPLSLSGLDFLLDEQLFL